ncbi:hypothetical protein PBR20603_04511 [Pandoraea bronchicola]|uniref:Uncharacterized protein n=1 Tax=Pandoraea bronchicola TaxID=2508287 RepID=A0A5E5BYW7_9BURK|nr:hypothetical protein PBR20603_04511 [Pandoraea bronchicola]
MQAAWAQDKRTSSMLGGQSSLAIRFHQDSTAGHKIHLLIGRLLTQPHEHREVTIARLKRKQRTGASKSSLPDRSDLRINPRKSLPFWPRAIFVRSSGSLFSH